MTQIILTPKQLAEKLKIDPKTLTKWQKRGLPHFRISRRCTRYDWDDVLKWLRLRHLKTTNREFGNGETNI